MEVIKFHIKYYVFTAFTYSNIQGQILLNPNLKFKL